MVRSRAEKNTEYKRQIRLIPGYIFTVLWIMFIVVTIGWIVLASLSTTREVFSNKLLASGVHFSNYVRIWQRNHIDRFFLNSLLYASVSVTAIIFIAAPAAYTIARKILRGKRIMINIFLIAMAIPMIMIVIPMYSVFSQMHMIGKRLPLVIMYIASSVPFSVFFLMSFFSNLPEAMEEAALIDGCSPGRAFWSVIFPLAQPGIITVSIFNFLGVWNEYIIAFAFASKTGIRPLSVGLQAIVQALKTTGDWVGMFSAVVIIFLPTFILYIFLSEKIVIGVTGGAVKG
jgi:N-acetylglucosamine transport system permease protein